MYKRSQTKKKIVFSVLIVTIFICIVLPSVMPSKGIIINDTLTFHPSEKVSHINVLWNHNPTFEDPI